MHRTRNTTLGLSVLFFIGLIGVYYFSSCQLDNENVQLTIKAHDKQYHADYKARVAQQTEKNITVKNVNVVECKQNEPGKTKPKVWLIRKEQSIRYNRLQHIQTVFKRVGYDIFDPKTDGREDWDVIWMLSYPYITDVVDWTQLKPHQRINHFPKCGSMTFKVRLATEHPMPEIPKAFQIPEQVDEFLAYTNEHTGGLWVQKKSGHRGVNIIPVEQMDLKSPGTFVQEYVDKPFLVDGRRFDIGIYVTMTSIHPLRLYVFNEWHMRFCPEEYYPFDPKNTKKYVVTSSDYIAPWDMPSMKKYFRGEGVSRKESLLHIIREKGFDTAQLETQLMNSIRKVYLTKEAGFIAGAQQYPSIRQFFEMVRFDFLFDESLNIYLMEVNLSPNMYPGKYTGHKLMYQQLIYNVLNLVGVASPVQSDRATSDIDEEAMQVSGKDIYTYTDHCIAPECADCKAELCQYCKACLTATEEASLKSAHKEHMNRQNFLRLFPRVFASQADAAAWDYQTDENFASLNEANQWISLWFRGKCMQDARWCS